MLPAHYISKAMMTTKPSNPLLRLQLENVWAGWRVEPVLRDLNWQWLAGQQWAVIGGNGAGKTTLAALISNQLQVSRGQLYRHPLWQQQDAIVQVSFERQQQLLQTEQRRDDSEFRDNAFDEGTTVEQFILRGLAVDQQYRQLLQSCGLEQLQHRGIRFLSTGETRKVLLAEALWRQPQLMILDAPFAGLDQQARTELGEVINHYQRQGQTMLLLLQSERELTGASDHILLLDQGRCKYIGPRQGLQVPITSPGNAAAKPLPPSLPRNYPVDFTQPLLELSHVNLRYQQQTVLRDINWTVRQGDQVALCGPNGAGKSSLLNLLYGDNHQAYGQQLRVLGRLRGDGESLQQLKQKFGVLSTRLQLDYQQRMATADVVSSGLFDSIGLYRQPSPQQRQQVWNWLEYIGLEDQAKRPFRQLSFGQQRLALLARAMLKSPILLLLDEPFIGLDPSHCHQLENLLCRISQETDTHMILVSHEPGEARSFINKTVTLEPHPEGGYTLSSS